MKITLNSTTVVEVSKQEAFDRAYRGVLKQGRLSTNRMTWRSHYTFPEKRNVHCGIGHVFVDHLTSEWDQGDTSIFALVWKGIIDADEDSVAFLESLQQQHDGASDMEDYKIKMEEFARANNLLCGVKVSPIADLVSGKITVPITDTEHREARDLVSA